MDTLALLLAREARALGLSAGDAPQDPGALAALARRVLEELHARGLIEGEEQLDCWATRRRPEH
ncbi:hypothetical protein [Deinococcus petrolearius]|uniref:Uncharacterized protein n=1 Tax=Deinococcus petrolearius TaxID=1751295 RepID=A0ABW1DEH5_9DEIO